MGNQPSQLPKKNMKRQVMKRPIQRLPGNLPQFPVQSSQFPIKAPQPTPPEQIFAYPQNLVPPPSRDFEALMVRPESTKIAPNLMNVNDKIDQFKKEQKNEENSFLQNLEKAKEQFYKKQKTKEEYFQDELKEFEKNYNPFRILHLEYNANEEDVKKAYRKFSLKYHPDRPDGNAKKFMMVSQAYIYLTQKLKEMQGNHGHNDLRNNAKKYFEEMEDKRKIQKETSKIEDRMEDQMEIGEKNFDQDKFNKIFEKNRMPTQFDKGYGNGWEDETYEENVVMNNKFTIDLFNKTFNEVKTKKLEQIKGNQVMKIDAPEPQLLSNLGYEELGREDIEDFTSGIQDNMNFVDYKAAYTRANVLEYDEQYNRGDYKNLDSLVRARDTQSFTVNNEDKEWINRREQFDKQKEQKRIDNMMAFDRMAEVYSNRANQHFIKNK
jgi:curved DNA-binding protein CbpA